MKNSIRIGGALALSAVVVAAVVAGGSTAAGAAEVNTWGVFTLDGSGGAYAGTMTLPGGFPETTFSTNSSLATLPTGVSTWQAATTPVGAVYGSSKNQPYLNQRPAANAAGSPAVTTYTFATPTPAGGWSFVLGDVDADKVTISATDADGQAVQVSQLGFQSVYNYCHLSGGPSCDSAGLNDQPTWTDNGATGVLLGNTAANDTEGAAGWFSPEVALSSLTLAFEWRKGFPVYQTWFVDKTFAASGTASLDGQPLPQTPVTVVDANDETVADVVTDEGGDWSVPQLVATDGYSAEATPPGESDPVPPVEFGLSSGDAADLDFAFESVVVVTPPPTSPPPSSPPPTVPPTTPPATTGPSTSPSATTNPAGSGSTPAGGTLANTGTGPEPAALALALLTTGAALVAATAAVRARRTSRRSHS
jgi:hypothetical protein